MLSPFPPLHPPSRVDSHQLAWSQLETLGFMLTHLLLPRHGLSLNPCAIIEFKHFHTQTSYADMDVHRYISFLSSCTAGSLDPMETLTHPKHQTTTGGRE